MKQPISTKRCGMENEPQLEMCAGRLAGIVLGQYYKKGKENVKQEDSLFVTIRSQLALYLLVTHRLFFSEPSLYFLANYYQAV